MSGLIQVEKNYYTPESIRKVVDLTNRDGHGRLINPQCNITYSDGSVEQVKGISGDTFADAIYSAQRLGEIVDITHNINYRC